MKFKSLTPTQHTLLHNAGRLNGCGPEDWRGTRPKFFFTADCNEHDWNYIVGGTEADRFKADAGFYKAMLSDVRMLAWWRRPWARLLAALFYHGVRRLGASSFRYGEKYTTFEEVLNGPV